VHLTISKDAAGICQKVMTYSERMTWRRTLTGRAPESVDGSWGTATISSLLGAKPSAGWVIRETKTLPVQKDLTDSEFPNLPHDAYYPASAVAVALLDSGNSAGSATFFYQLTAGK
jgi:hypothetical protein